MNRKLLFIAICTFMHLLLIDTVYAVKAFPQPYDITQPDGTSLTIKLVGDEFSHYNTTADDYNITKNSKGYFVYTQLNSNGAAIESNVIARNLDKRSAQEIKFLNSLPKYEIASTVQRSKIISSSTKYKTNQIQRAYPLSGSPKSIIILVNFSDLNYVVPTPQTAYTNLLNEVGYSTNGGTGSARDYFMSASYGLFAPDFDVFGPVTLPHTMAYYGANDTNGNDLNPTDMIVDACAAADAAGLDFTPYDTDGDNLIDNVFVYYAGFNEAEGQGTNLSTIWPHRWVIYTSAENSTNYTYDGTVASVTFDGKRVFDYACTSELRGKTGENMCGIGTFSHEFGHVVGLPDYYHTTSSTYKATLEYYSIMDLGTYLNSGRTPPTYSTYDRFYLGWLTPQEIKTASDQTLLPIYQGKTTPANTNQQSYILSATTHNLNGSNPSPSEFFVLENRKKTGWDTYLPTEGMFIWHIDYNLSAWDANAPNNYTGTTQTTGSHMRVYLQPLSGSTTTPGEAFTTGSFTPTTWSGTNINRPITSIDGSGTNVTFKLLGGTPIPTLTISGTINEYKTNQSETSYNQEILVTATNLVNNLNIQLSNGTGSDYEMKLSTQSVWSKSLSIVPSSGGVNVTLQVRFTPTSVGAITDVITFESGSTFPNVVHLTGEGIDPNAPRVGTGLIQNSLQLASTKVNDMKTKTLNIKTNDIYGNLTLTVSGTNASYFTVSPTTITKEVANGNSGTNITITYKPLFSGTHTATLTISGGGLNPNKVINLSGECN